MPIVKFPALKPNRASEKTLPAKTWSLVSVTLTNVFPATQSKLSVATTAVTFTFYGVLIYWHPACLEGRILLFSTAIAVHADDGEHFL